MIWPISIKKGAVLFFFLLLSGSFFVRVASAGTLSCTVEHVLVMFGSDPTCEGGAEINIFQMESSANAHASLTSQQYAWLVCCSGVDGLGNSCSGTYATALKLSGTTDAHARQGTLSDYPSATNACISVPTGGSVIVGYQATDCTGYDTMLGSMIGTTNSHVGDGSWTAGTTKICATAVGAGSLSVDIVDSGGTPVGAPAIVIQTTTLTLNYQTVTGTFGTTNERMRATNTSINPQWSLTIAAAGGPTSLMSAGTPKYDFNDPTGSGGDGGDADAYGGQMTLTPTAGTLAGTCSSTGVLKGSAAAFSQGVTDVITILTADNTADTGCYWDFTGVGVSQTIPPEQVPGSYAIDMSLTIAAY